MRARLPTATQWPEQWRKWISSFHPNVVVVLAGRWEVLDRTYNRQWTNILHPAYARYVKTQIAAGGECRLVGRGPRRAHDRSVLRLGGAT